MNKDVCAATIWGDEAEAFFIVEPLYGSNGHAYFLSFLRFTAGGVVPANETHERDRNAGFTGAWRSIRDEN